MLHHLAVFRADRAAGFASLDASPQLRAGKLEVCAREARNDARRREANVRAIIAIADAIHHMRDILLPEARVGTGVARFRAGVAGGDALDIHRVIR